MLVEISPKEFAQFIGKEMVLPHGHRPERKDYIMDKLVVPVAE